MLEKLKSLFRPTVETEEKPLDWRIGVKKHLKKIKATKAQYRTVLDLLEFAKFFRDTLTFEMGWYEDEEDIKLLKFCLSDPTLGKPPLVFSIEDDGNVDEHPRDTLVLPDPLGFAKFAISVWAYAKND